MSDEIKIKGTFFKCAKCSNLGLFVVQVKDQVFIKCIECRETQFTVPAEYFNVVSCVECKKFIDVYKFVVK